MTVRRNDSRPWREIAIKIMADRLSVTLGYGNLIEAFTVMKMGVSREDS